MKKVLVFAHLLCCVLIFPQQKEILTAEERAWLTEKTVISYCIDPDWYPIEALLNGRHEGLTKDYIQLLENLLDTKFILIQTKSWAESLEYAEKGLCDLLPFLNKTPEREKYLLFTESYFQAPHVIVTQYDSVLTDGLTSLKGKILAASPGYMIYDYVKINHPDIIILNTADLDESLAAVSMGTADAASDSLFTVMYSMQKLGLSNLKLTGQSEIYDFYRAGISSNNSMLLNIIQKALNAVSYEQKLSIFAKWSQVNYVKDISYRLFLRIFLTGLAVLVFLSIFLNILIIKNRMLKKLKTELEIKNAELEKLSATDRLTGLHNRLKIDEIIEAETARAARYGSTFSIILFDLDYFKNINDSYGHHKGDEVLKAVAYMLKSRLRTTDIPGRWGGEEFIIILPMAAIEKACELASSLRLSIKEICIDPDIKINASFGIAEFSKGGNPENLFIRADKALYTSKAEGRDRITAG